MNMNALGSITAPSKALSALAIGDVGIVTAVTGPFTIRRRLLEMGLCPGVAITVLRRAPLGDPIEVRVRGYLLSLRLDQAAQVAIAVGQPAMVATVD